MPRILFALCLLAASAAAHACSDLLSAEFRPLAGKEKVDLCKTYAGKVLLVVNTASKCGFTPQYDALEKLHATYADRGFAVLGFPSNDFAGQEPGTNEEIQAFCRSVYGVDFPMFAKLAVKGEAQAPLYRLLTETALPRIGAPSPDKASGRDVRWNFEKFLVSRTGAVVARFDPAVVPLDPAIVGAVERELAA
jgi:glutathione peroxidase